MADTLPPPVDSPRKGGERYFREPNLAGTRAIRQHYVPRLYLANFADNDRVAAYDFETSKAFEASLHNVGVAAGFYDLQLGEQTVSTEAWLAEVEGAAAPIIARLLVQPEALTALSTEDENLLARFLCAQRVRVPAFREFNRRTREYLVGQVKEFAKAYLKNTFGPKEASDIWRIWQTKPDQWWLGSNEPIQEADTATFMLGEVQGLANLLRAMPWRIGFVDARLTLYCSDNPISGYLPPTLPWWSGGAFLEFVYFVPLSTRVLLQMGPIIRGPELQPKGERLREDFSSWETSFARHVVSREATRFLYGPGPYVSRECASSCLERISHAKLVDAVALQGFDPRPPAMPVEL